MLEQSAFVRHLGEANILPRVDAAMRRSRSLMEPFDGLGPEVAAEYREHAPV